MDLESDVFYVVRVKWFINITKRIAFICHFTDFSTSTMNVSLYAKVQYSSKPKLYMEVILFIVTDSVHWMINGTGVCN